MTVVARILAIMLVVPATFYFIYWVPFSLLPLRKCGLYPVCTGRRPVRHASLSGSRNGAQLKNVVRPIRRATDGSSYH